MPSVAPLVPDSVPIPPFTIDTLALALPELKFTTSPISYPVPPASTKMLSILPEPTAST